LDAHYDLLPELIGNGETVPYAKKAVGNVKRAEGGPPPGSGAPVTLEPGREIQANHIRLDDWYESLPPGEYKLTVRRRFAWDGDWVESNPVYFEVQPRIPGGPIPPGVTIELVPEGSDLKKKDGDPYQLGREDYNRIFIRNHSHQSLKVNVIDRYYGNRPQLFKDGVLIPYRQETESLIKSKEENPRLVELANDFLIDPGPRSSWTYIKLSEWYGPLKPGTYRLINRGRFEIDGPWTAESAPLLFEILAANKR
jgi:hypothetical protein